MSEDAEPKQSALLIGGFAVALGLVHVSEIEASRAAVLSGIAAADASAAAQGKAVREAVLMAAGNIPGLDPDVRGNRLGEAMLIRQGTASSPGINALRKGAGEAAAAAADASARARFYGLASGALQIAILLVAAALAMGERRMRLGGAVLGGIGVALAALTAMGLL